MKTWIVALALVLIGCGPEGPDEGTIPGVVAVRVCTGWVDGRCATVLRNDCTTIPPCPAI